MTTDRQAALAAASQIMAASIEGMPVVTIEAMTHCEGRTLAMADTFASWLTGERRGPAIGRPMRSDADERLTPNVDFRSAIGSRWSLGYAGPHKLDPVKRTPSGKFACLCGEAWPCSQRSDAGDMPTVVVPRAPKIT